MAFKKKIGKRSPLKAAPLRNPGESLDREIERIIDEEVLSYFAVVFAFTILAAFEWYEWFLKLPPQPIVFTLLALGMLVFFGYKLFLARHNIQLLQLGLDGEKAVGQGLEDLRTQGCEIIHDVPGDGFNIDHVILSQHGIVAVETKTYSKPATGRTVITFDGETISVNGKSPTDEPINQALAESSWLKRFLSQSAGKEFPVKAALVFPEWFVEHVEKKKRNDLWVLNPTGLASFIAHEPLQISHEDVALATSRLSDYVRNYSKN